MKKTLLMLIVISLALTTSGLVLAESNEQGQTDKQGLEKKPGLMQKFEQKKEVKEKLERKMKVIESKKFDEDVADNPNLFMGEWGDGKTSEKIASPKDIKFFNKIKQIGKSLFGIRKNNAIKPVLIKPENATCVKTAVSAKGVSLKTAMTARNQSVLTAFDTRITCELAALDKTTAEEQRDANKACMEAEKKSREESQSAFEKANEATREIFRKAVVACVKGDTSTSATVTTN